MVPGAESNCGKLYCISNSWSIHLTGILSTLHCDLFSRDFQILLFNTCILTTLFNSSSLYFRVLNNDACSNMFNTYRICFSEHFTPSLHCIQTFPHLSSKKKRYQLLVQSTKLIKARTYCHALCVKQPPRWWQMWWSHATVNWLFCCIWSCWSQSILSTSLNRYNISDIISSQSPRL